MQRPAKSDCEFKREPLLLCVNLNGEEIPDAR